MSLIERSFREKIVLVGVTLPPRTTEDTEAGLDELSLLVDTAGADEVGRVIQRRRVPDPPTFVGKGKAAELQEVAVDTDCDTVVFDNDLTPAQQRNLEKLLGRTAIDRTAVILDIFAQNAHSPEGKAQVELAMLRYRLPRMRGKGSALSQQGGGMSAGGARIGTRGPGETQLEVDRRRILRRIHKLEAELREIDKHRATQRKAQHRSRTRRVAIVGYTNAGKSTLLNRLTQAGVLVEDRLFATLDATTRRLDLPGGEAVLVTDTVGFIRSYPTSSSRPSSPRSTWWPTLTCSCTWSTRPHWIRTATSTPCAPCCARSARTRCPSSSRSTRATSPVVRPSASWTCTRARWR